MLPEQLRPAKAWTLQDLWRCPVVSGIKTLAVGPLSLDFLARIWCRICLTWSMFSVHSPSHWYFGNKSFPTLYSWEPNIAVYLPAYSFMLYIITPSTCLPGCCSLLSVWDSASVPVSLSLCLFLLHFLTPPQLSLKDCNSGGWPWVAMQCSLPGLEQTWKYGCHERRWQMADKAFLPITPQ